MTDSSKALIFLDIDGTLLDNNYSVNDEEITEKIRELQKQGFLFSLNSNRSVEDIKAVAERFSIKGALIGENGVFYYSQKNRAHVILLEESEITELQRAKSMAEESLEAICKKMFPRLSYNFIPEDTVSYLSNIDGKRVEKGGIYALSNKYRKYTSSIHFYISNQHGKLEKLAPAEIRKISLELQKTVNPDTAAVIASDTFGNILLQSTRTDKKRGGIELSMKLGIDSMYSIGDELGDSDIAGSPKRFLCVGNSAPAVKKASSFSSNKCYTLGVRECLDEIVKRGRNDD